MKQFACNKCWPSILRPAIILSLYFIDTNLLTAPPLRAQNLFPGGPGIIIDNIYSSVTTIGRLISIC